MKRTQPDEKIGGCFVADTYYGCFYSSMYAPGPGLSFVSMPKLVLRLALEKNPPSDNLFTEIKVY